MEGFVNAFKLKNQSIVVFNMCAFKCALSVVIGTATTNFSNLLDSSST